VVGVDSVSFSAALGSLARFRGNSLGLSSRIFFPTLHNMKNGDGEMKSRNCDVPEV